MYILLILSLLSGTKELEQPGFKSLEQCELRAVVYRQVVNFEKYMVVCYADVSKDAKAGVPFIPQEAM